MVRTIGFFYTHEIINCVNLISWVVIYVVKPASSPTKIIKRTLLYCVGLKLYSTVFVRFIKKDELSRININKSLRNY